MINRPFLRLFRNPLDALALGILVVGLMSPYGTNVVFNFGGNYYPEAAIVLILGIGLIRSWWGGRVRSGLKVVSTRLILIILGLLTLAFLGGLWHGDWLAAYSDLRALTAFSFSLLLVSRLRQSIPDPVDSVLVLSALMSLLLFSIFYNIDSTDRLSVKALYPALAVPLLMSIAAERQARSLFLFSVLLAVVVSITSFYRAIWIVSGVSILVYGSLMLFDSRVRRASIRVPIGVALGVVGIFILMYQYQDLLIGYLSSSEGRYIQSIAKLENLLGLLYGGELGGGDDLRWYYVTYIISQYLSLLPPSGLGHKAMIDNVAPIFAPPIPMGNTLDSAWLFLAVHFGLIFGVGLMLALLLWVLKFCKRILPWNRRLIFGGFLVFGFYASTTAVFLTHIPSAILGGAWLGYLLSPRLSADCKWGMSTRVESTSHGV